MVDNIISNKHNPDPLKRAHSPQGMLSLIDSTECCGRKRKEGECYTKAIIKDPDPEVKLYHRAYLQCLGKSACLKQELQQSKYRDLLCSKQEPLKHTHLPQGMLSLIDPTGCYVMKRKDEKCYRQYNGKTVADMDYIWGENESMSNSPTVPEARLHKRHNILLFHYVKSMISQGYINLQHLASEWNFADMVTKNGSYQSSYYKLIQPLFHHSGNTAALFLDNILEVDVSIAEGSIFGILGSEKLSNYCYILAAKRSEKPMNAWSACVRSAHS